jgi:type I restriction enzyme S subunit
MWTAHRSSTRIEAGYRRSRVTSSDLLVSVKGTVGRVGLVPVGFEGNISRDVARVRLCSHHVPEYWLQLLRSDAAQRAVRDASVGTTRMELSIATLKLLTFRVPAVAEQRRIAETLSQGDALVAALERLIAKKEAMKQGLMQELLSGRTRLPGFEGEWKERELGSLADIVSGGTPSSSIPAYWAGGIPWCTPTDITSQIGRHLHQTERTITKEGLDACSARLLPSGSVLLCTRATIGELKIASVPTATNQGFKALVPRFDVDGDFLYYTLLIEKDRLAAKGTGSTFLEVSRRDVASLVLAVPPREAEQRAIAQVLTDADDELATLRTRLTKAQAVKRGMMQALLTGRTRLPVPVPAETGTDDSEADAA